MRERGRPHRPLLQLLPHASLRWLRTARKQRIGPAAAAAPGRSFPPGVSGNAGGRPKGIPTFSILRMIAEALTDEATRKEAILRLRDSVKQRKTVVQTLEFAARVNREIGLGSEASV
jgi:hypothetical protein